MADSGRLKRLRIKKTSTSYFSYTQKKEGKVPSKHVLVQSL